jgi:hypothetical protein
MSYQIVAISNAGQAKENTIHKLERAVVARDSKALAGEYYIILLP